MLTGAKAAVFPPVRQLGPADLTRCSALSVDRGWSPEQSKWGLLLAASEVFGVDAPDGRGLAGSVTLTRWGPDFAAVGMMLVATRYSRQGLGRTLMEHLLRAAGQDATVTLFATDMGRPLYEKLGFQVVRVNASFTGHFRPDNSKRRRARPAAAADLPGRVRLATEADLPALLALDRAAFGADRSRIITRLPAFADHIAIYEPAEPTAVPGATIDGHVRLGGAAATTPATPATPAAPATPATPAPCNTLAIPASLTSPAGPTRPVITGYAAAWRNGPASTVIGPLVAPDGAVAQRLITEIAAHTSTPIRLDLDPDRPELPGWALAHGLEPVGRTVVMARGDTPNRGLPDHLFTPISVALA